uniref:Transcription elongation factor GreA n=1 Tax=candidate division CPR3 bacterium TaxID=2268181 RepID=A0A7C4R5C0_UNCC3
MSNDKTVVITSEGLDKLKKEYAELINVKRPELVTRLALARGQGDLSENSEYAAARQDLTFIDGRIAELEKLIHDAKVVVSHSKTKVDIGCKVTLHMKGKKDIFTIVGEWEADPAQKKISHSSPLGRALIGRKIGDEVEVEAPVGKIIYKIIHIE